jgi:hypothetical protein
VEGISSFLPGLLREIVSNDETILIFLDELWPQIVGNNLSLKCRPVRLTKKRLVIAVSNEVWKDELVGMRQMLIQTINQFWNVHLIEELKFEDHFLERDSAIE